MKKIGIISGDERYAYAKNYFVENGYDATIVKNGIVADADVIILSVRDELSDTQLEKVFFESKKYAVVFSGNKKRIERFYDGFVCDYSESERFVIENAYLTAEAALVLTRQLSKKSLLGEKAFVIGYGRIGKFLAEMLKNSGCEVYVYARRESSVCDAALHGAKYAPLDSIATGKYSFVYNTVPQKIVPKSVTDAAAPGILTIELASEEGGFEDENYAVRAPGLPGRILPESAGRAVYKTIADILSKVII